VIFAWIKSNRSKRFTVKALCNILDVSRGGYYAWLGRKPSRRRERRDHLVEQIRQVHADSDGTYGSPRVHAELADRRVKVCLNTVAKLMKDQGIRSVRARRFVARTTDSSHGCPVAANVLNRDFAADAPDRKWCCDITYVPTAEGFLYLAAVMDLCSRRIVGWAMAEHLRTELCLEALGMALETRSPAEGLIHHSDRGVQYASADYAAVLAEHGITCSMSRSGDCYDNAAMESFWCTLKTECVYPRQRAYATRAEARQAIFRYIECWYNRQRRHSAIGYVSPEAFEASLN
jgi:transposase InsO family protein